MFISNTEKKSILADLEKIKKEQIIRIGDVKIIAGRLERLEKIVFALLGQNAKHDKPETKVEKDLKKPKYQKKGWSEASRKAHSDRMKAVWASRKVQA